MHAIFSKPCMKPFLNFLSAVAFFHVSEFVLASIYMRKDLSRRCKCYDAVPAMTAPTFFMQFHICPVWLNAAWLISEPYCVAMLLACLEYWLEIRYCSIVKLEVVACIHIHIQGFVRYLSQYWFPFHTSNSWCSLLGWPVFLDWPW